jgi:hypothetical protein
LGSVVPGFGGGVFDCATRLKGKQQRNITAGINLEIDLKMAFRIVMVNKNLPQNIQIPTHPTLPVGSQIKERASTKIFEALI